MSLIHETNQKVLHRKISTPSQALPLLGKPIDEFCSATGEIRHYFCSGTFIIYAITNAKSGLCSEG